MSICLYAPWAIQRCCPPRILIGAAFPPRNNNIKKCIDIIFVIDNLNIILLYPATRPGPYHHHQLGCCEIKKNYKDFKCFFSGAFYLWSQLWWQQENHLDAHQINSTIIIINCSFTTKFNTNNTSETTVFITNTTI